MMLGLRAARLMAEDARATSTHANSAEAH